jgi:hypothetical protein
LTLLVSLGHLAFYIPTLVGLELKQFIGKNIIKDILLPSSNSENENFSETLVSLLFMSFNNAKSFYLAIFSTFLDFI